MQRKKDTPSSWYCKKQEIERRKTWNECFSASLFNGRVGSADFGAVLFGASRSRKIKHKLGNRGWGGGIEGRGSAQNEDEERRDEKMHDGYIY